MARIRRLLSTRNIVTLLILLAASAYFLVQKLKVEHHGQNGNLKDIRSIAVLPFTNANANSEQQYFSDGLTEDVLNDLSRIKGLKVCARTSSFLFRGNIANVQAIGQKLKVSALLDGSLQIQGDRIEVTVKLIDVKDASQIWTGRYAENMDNISALQTSISSAVAEKLQIKSSSRDRAPAKKFSPKKAAYALYLQGRSYWNLRTAPDLKKAIDLFGQAIVLDSLYAAAYSGLADCYTALGYGSFMAPREAFPKALEAATKALQIDSTLAEPHASLGYYKFYYEWDWAAAEQEFRASIARNANYELGYDWYGYYLTAMRRYDEARVVLKKAEELDPLSVPISTDMGFSFYYSGSYDQSINELKGSLQRNPKFALAHLWLGRAYQGKNMYQDAISEYKKTLVTIVDWPVALAAIGNVYGQSGNKASAQQILDTLTSLSQKRFVTAYGIALVYAGLGKKEQAFAWLNKAFDERSNWLVWLKSDPRWATISSDKRYIEMVNKIGLPN
jgi:TolB-like protein